MNVHHENTKYTGSRLKAVPLILTFVGVTLFLKKIHQKSALRENLDVL